MLKRVQKLLLPALALVLASLVAIPAAAQSQISGDLTGTITDPSGAVVPGANVTLKNNATGASQTATTNSAGAYRFSLLPPGSYTVTAAAQGFQGTSQRVQVAVGQASAANLQLAVGGSGTTVEVTAQGGVVDTQNGNLSTTFTPEQIQLTPNPGNDLTYIVQTAPGAVMNTQSGYGNSSTYGLPATSNLFTVNGENENDPFLNLNNSGATNIMLGQNDINEATVVNNGYSGQYGQLGGANVNYVTKSGSNAFHGNLIYYWNGRIMNANDWFNNHSATPRPFDNANQWAASLGGPIKKNKTFFFADTEGLRLLIPTSSEVNIPSPQFQAATLANIAATSPSQVPFYTNMFNLYSHAPGAARAANSLPAGTATDTGATIGNGCTGLTAAQYAAIGAGAPCALQFFSTAGNQTNEWLLTSRFDQIIGDRDRAFVHFRTDHGLQASYTDPLTSTFNSQSNQPQYEGQLNETHTFSSNAVNQFILSGSWYSAIFSPVNLTSATRLMPFELDFSGRAFYPLGFELSVWPQGRRTTQYQIVDDYSLVHGNHQLKFGVNWHRDDITDADMGIGTIGASAGETLGSFFSGTGVSFTQSFPNRLSNPVDVYGLDFYAQDEWSARKNLKITLGLRAEHNSNPICVTNCFSRFDNSFLNLSHDVAQPYNQSLLTGLSQALINQTNVRWEPRFGFAWTPGGHNTVIRGGVGIFSDIFPATVADYFMRNAPLDNTFTGGPGLLAPTAAGSQASAVAAANASFTSAYRAGGTLASIVGTNPLFLPPNLYSPDRTIHYPEYQEWNLQLQQGFGQKTSVSLSYVGNHGIWEPVVNGGQNAYCNATPLPFFPTSTPCTASLGTTAAAFTGLPAVPADQRFGTIFEVQSKAVSNYNGASVNFTRRFSQVQLQLNYSWSHALDEISNGGFLPFNFSSATGGNNISVLGPQNPFNLRQYNYGNADYDTRQYVSANYVWNVPKINGWKGVLADWTVSGTLFYRTGLPYTILDPTDFGALQAFNYSSVTPPTAPNLFANYPAGTPVSCSRSATTTPCYTAGMFSPAINGFGFQRRNQFYGPNFFDTDITVMKNFHVPITEAGMFSVGLQAFNVLNHANFDQPDQNLGSPTFGLITHAIGPPTSMFGSFLGGDASPRIVQIKAELSF
ncbi:MAG: TonB-dependent receptor [Acidobacteriaceae bacterium]|nr:TonB-dependent receptor [Acidobacteriaceae bacterium]